MSAGDVRVSAEDRRQVQTDINGVRYTAQRGYFEMPPEAARLHRESGNLPSPAAAGPVNRGHGFRCTGCGFGSFFTTCSRCGEPCTREAL